MSGLSTDATIGLRVTGYTQADLTKLAARVSAYNNGSKALVLGTKVALASVLPDDVNYRFQIDSEFVKMGYVRNIAGIDTLEIPQVADWATPFSLLISDSYLWIVAPGTDKIVKCVIGGSTISNMNGNYDSANLQINASFTKFWKAGVVTSSVAATIGL